MKVHEVQPLQPLDHMYELKSDMKYIILIPITLAPSSVLNATLTWLKRANIDAIIISVHDTSGLRIFDVESLP